MLKKLTRALINKYLPPVSFSSRKYHAVIFIDNKFKFHFDQISHYFESGFFTPDQVLVVSKYYQDSYTHTMESARNLGISVLFFSKNCDIPEFDNKIIFYPYNGQLNCRLLLNRNARHVLLTHGESNKKASINPMARIYDHVLAYGNIAIDRYLDYGIFSQNDVDSGRVIMMGDSLTAPIPYTPADGTYGTGFNDCIIYMPTWEGGLEEENFSSVSEPRTFEILLALSRKFQTSNLLVQAHPNLGGRIPDYKTHFYALLSKLHDAGLRIFYPATGDQKQNQYLYRSIDSRHILSPADDSKYKIQYGAVDVSASEAMLAAKKISTIVLCKERQQFYAPRSYLSLRERCLVCLDQEEWRDTVDNYVGSIKDFQLQQKYRSSLFAYSSPELLHMSHSERFAWLCEFLHKQKRPSVPVPYIRTCKGDLYSKIF